MGAGKVTLSMVTLVLKPELILFSDQNGNANSKKYMKYKNFVILMLWLFYPILLSYPMNQI